MPGLVTEKYDQVSKSAKIDKFFRYIGQIWSFLQISKDEHHPWNIVYQFLKIKMKIG